MASIAYCSRCGAETDWVSSVQTARILKVSEARVRQLITEGRLQGAVKYMPPDGTPWFWKIPLESVAALLETRQNT
jgi:hypothetical protein